MARRSVTILAAALFAWAARGPASDEPARAPVQTGAITGLVVDLKGNPVAGAAVWGTTRPRKTGPTRTGPDGRFRLTGFEPDKAITIWADASHLSRERHEGVRIFPDKDHDIGQITLLPGTRIVGRVIDSRGQPVGGAAVNLELFRHQLGHTVTAQETEWTLSGANDGRFATPPLPAGKAHFYLSAPGKVRTFIAKIAEPGTPFIDLGDVALPDEMLVKGTVIDTEGKPAPGVEIVPDYDWQNSTKTDEGGRFVVRGVGEKLKILQLRSNDYFSPEPFDAAPGQTDLKLKVIKAYEIRGTAVDAETGKPVRIDTVQLCMVERDPDDGHVTLLG
jgi:hypothetical protein